MYAIGQYGFSPAIENELQISNFAVLLPDVIIMDRKVQERALDYFERGAETSGRKIDCGSQPVYGFIMTPLGWPWALFVWGYAPACFLVNDQVKRLVYRVFGRPHDHPIAVLRGQGGVDFQDEGASSH